MNELIKIEVRENGQRLVSARELHEKLKVQKDFSDWIKNQLESIDAVEGIEFTSLKGKTSCNGGRPTIEYALTIDTAKEICMVVGVSPRTNEETRALSKKFRKYFIECEKQLKENQKSLPTTYKEALRQLLEEVEAKEKLEAEKQKLEIETKEQKRDIEVKQSAIDGLTQNISLADKRQRISQIVRHNHTNYEERWKLLYSEFNRKYHMDVDKRLRNAKERKEVSKSYSKMDFICNRLDMTNELYSIACKLYMADFSQLLVEWNTTIDQLKVTE